MSEMEKERNNIWEKNTLHQYSKLPNIYKLTDTRNGKIYIGKHTPDINRLKGYFTGGTVPVRIIKKHGKKIFKREIIVEGNFNDELLNQLEIHYIRLFCSYVGWDDRGYNLTIGGEGATGNRHTDKTKIKMSKTRKGLISGKNHHFYNKKLSEEHKQKISESHKGKVKTKEHIKNNALARSGKNHWSYGKPFPEKILKNLDFSGRKHTEETKKKMSESSMGDKNPMYGKKQSEETKKKRSESLKKYFSNNFKKCEYCGGEFNIPLYNRRHGNNCKNKDL